MTRLLLLLLVAFALGGCSSAPQVSPSGLPSVSLTLTCPTDSRAPKAAYVGPYMGVENVIPLQELARDLHCADAFKQSRYPKGFVTIFGSSRIAPCASQPCTSAISEANQKVYLDVHEFAKAWTRAHGKAYPIMTGAGRGLMEAGSRGAKDAGGPSIGYTTYYDTAQQPTALRPYGGDPTTAFNDAITEGLIFSSVALRETAMVKHSAAMVLTPGGSGTEWEIFQILETIKSKQLTKVVVYVFGEPIHWKSFSERLKDFYARGVVKDGELSFTEVTTAEALASRLEADLGLQR